MKIYYEPPTQIPEIDTAVDAMTAQLPPELAPIVQPPIEMLRTIYTEKLIQYFELIKYKLMWALRFIEQDIEAEDGHFMINSKGGLEMIDFSEGLVAKIRAEIAAHYKK